MLLIVLGTQGLSAQNGEKITREEYLDTYSDLAMKEMQRVGIPASITLAQGCLESDNGNSSLSTKGNNHFGIKCHDWTGKKMYHDDDERDECFRVYKTAYDSFMDHSLFLTTKSRYEFLFDLKPGNYKGWARGLQKAGYATSNKYSSLLIMIIEDNELYTYDKTVLSGKYEPAQLVDMVFKGGTDIKDGGRTIYLNNRVEYIIVEDGDTPALLREELDLYPNEIYRYNNFAKGMSLDSGMILYLQPKRLRAEKRNDTHEVREGESMRDISQAYAVKIRRLYFMNNLDMDTELKTGTILNLRKRVKVEKAPRVRPAKEEPLRESEEQGEMEFEFDGS